MFISVTVGCKCRFPFSKPHLLEKWKNSLQRDGWQPTQYSLLCSKHFLESDFLTGYAIRRHLKDDAVPSVFDTHTNVSSSYSLDWVCHTGLISLCIDLFVFICVYSVCFFHTWYCICVLLW